MIRRPDMGFLDIFKKEKKKDEKTVGPQYLYSDEELDILDEFICDMFGEYKNVFHEIASPDVHLDVCIVDPTDEEPFYKLVTMGAGAYTMNIPEQWKDYQIEHAEYVIYLPKDWNIQSSKDEDYWPIKTLKDVARLPIWYDTWLCYGHTTQADEDGSPYASNTGFNSVVLDFAENKQGDVRLIMPSGKVINFYEIIALYPEELAFKIENGADALFEKFKEEGIQYKVLDTGRKNAMQ